MGEGEIPRWLRWYNFQLLRGGLVSNDSEFLHHGHWIKLELPDSSRSVLVSARAVLAVQGPPRFFDAWGTGGMVM